MNPTAGAANLDLLRAELAKLAFAIENHTVKSPTNALERILRGLETSLQMATRTLRESNNVGTTGMTSADLDQLRDAHRRLVVTMRHWSSDTKVIAAALTDALDNWPAKGTSPTDETES